MLLTHDITVDEIENYINRIFDLKDQLRDKDFKIIRLEFELALEKQLVNSLKRVYLPSLLTKDSKEEVNHVR